jgi:hypothetical protein
MAAKWSTHNDEFEDGWFQRLVNEGVFVMTHRLGFGFVAIATLGLMLASASDANAFFGGRNGGSCGSHGGYGSNGGNGSHGSEGSRGGFFSRLRGRGSNGSNGGYGSNGGHGSCGSHGGNGGYHENGHHDGDHGDDGDHKENGDGNEAGYRGQPQQRDLNESRRQLTRRQDARYEQASLPQDAKRRR